MYISTVSILLSLGGKCLLNWVLVFLQMKQIPRSFLGNFSVSLAAVDTALTLSAATIHINSDKYVVLFGYLMTKYDVCLFVLIIERISRILQWPVVVLAAADHFCTVTQRLHASNFKPTYVHYLFVTVFLWTLTALYIILLCDFIPDISNQNTLSCQVFYSLNTLHIILLLLFILACATMFSLISCFLKNPTSDQSQTLSRRSLVQQTLQRFLHNWIVFLVVLALLFFLPVGIPSYMDLNVAWLCCLNSLLLAVLCAVCSNLQLSQDLAAAAAADSF